MTEDFVIARNPDPDSTLPYVLRVPLGEHGILLKSRETWPRTSKVYCHRVEDWPVDAEILERIPVRSCTRRGAAVDLVLDRGRENRSQFVITQVRGGRQAIFWQTARTTKQARPRVSTPTARASGIADLEITVDSHERYAWTFGEQQATTVRGALVAGDYGVHVEGRLVAAVERKSMDDLVSSLTTGTLKYQMADLAALPRAAVVVEERYSAALRHRIVRAAVVADAIAECQVAFPEVPIMFCETRKLAQEWSYRFLAAALSAAHLEEGGAEVVAGLAEAEPLLDEHQPVRRSRRRAESVVPGMPSAATDLPAPAAEIRAWAAANGHRVADRGRIRADVVWAYREAHPGAGRAGRE